MGPTPTRTARLDEFLVEIAAGTDFPAVSSAIEQVLAKTAEEASIQRITNVILKDYSITLKILRTANSAFYNRSGRPIISISHAVSLLGLDTVRQIVTGLVLIEQFSRRSPGLKELMLLSLLSANHAREVADFVGYARPEEAYLCGMLRNLGEVLVGCFRPREYAAILLRVHEDRCPVEQPSLEILGFRYEEAGVAVAVLWAIPASVQASMSEPVFHLRNAQDSDAERLKSITYFAHKLTNAVYRREPGSARASVSLLLNSLGPTLGLSEEAVQGIVDRSLQETGEIFSAMRVPIDRLRLKRQIEAALRPAEEEPETNTQLEPVAEADLLGRLVREIEAEVDGGAAGQLQKVTLMVLEAIYRGGPFDRVLFALLDTEHNRLVGKLGFGEGIDQVIDRFNFPVVGSAGPVSVAVVKKTDVFNHNARDHRYDATRFVQALGAPVFGLFPVVVDEVVVGCLYFDRLSPKAADTSVSGALSGVRALRDQLRRAVSQARAAAVLRPSNIQPCGDPQQST